MKHKNMQSWLAAPHAVWSVLFIIAPLIFVAYYAFTDKEGAFTLDNVANALSRSTLIIFFRSISFALIATFICLIIAYPLAYALSKSKASTQKIMIMLVMLPMWMNFLIRTYAIMVLIQDTGIINSFLGNFGIGPIHILGTETAVIIGMVYDYLPYMILPIYTVMTKLDYRLVEAADLGCNGFAVLRKVIIPLSLSGVISGVTMVLVPSISTFYISQKLGGVDMVMIGDVIEQQYNASNYNMTASLSLVLMVILLLGLIIVNRFSDGDGEDGMMP